MPSKREQLKVKLMAEVEAMVEESLAKGEDEWTVEAIEDLALSARDQLARPLTGGLVAQQAERRDADLPPCPDCGQALRPKGKQGRYLRTRSGEIRLERDYFYWEGCGQGHFPPG